MIHIKASTNNFAETVLGNFVEAFQEWGLPSRVRGDRGGENIQVAILMATLRGENRASFLWGS